MRIEVTGREGVYATCLPDAEGLTLRVDFEKLPDLWCELRVPWVELEGGLRDLLGVLPDHQAPFDTPAARRAVAHLLGEWGYLKREAPAEREEPAESIDSPGPSR